MFSRRKANIFNAMDIMGFNCKILDLVGWEVEGRFMMEGLEVERRDFELLSFELMI